MPGRSLLFFWPVLLFIGLPFFFLGGPGFHSARSFAELWNLGHILYFALFTLWLQRILRNAKISSLQGLTILFFLPFLVGFLIECLQYLVNGRSPSIADMLRNQLGVLTALVYQTWPQQKKNIPRCLAALLIRSLVALLLLAALTPVLTAVWDEQQAQRQFPLLADFESSHELSRWYYPRQLQLEDQIVRHGKKAARVQLSTAKYSGIALFHFPHNWQGYRWLRFSVYNPLQHSLELHCRLDDTEHRRQHGPYEDRFNTRFTLKPGWNDLSISLQQAAASPRGRAMDMTSIKGFGLFVVKQQESIAIYLDHVYLE